MSQSPSRRMLLNQMVAAWLDQVGQYSHRERDAMAYPDTPRGAEIRKLHGRLVDKDGRFLAECWAQAEGSRMPPGNREARCFGTLEEARN